ncbi:MAG TPA: tripartite tricarboxylate transporter substrate binding protein [Burkholderiales bacterium]|nr:tripartite tricarboxylate transporter substrate binding protein [Burkholderiales bacterium]
MARRILLLFAASFSLVTALAPSCVLAQAYPSKPVKIIVPAQPGGGLDLIGRTVADQLGRAMEQSFIVENVSGGGGQIASQATARAAPDGYTLMVGYVGTHGTNPAVRKVPYDAVRDFTAIAMVGGTPNVLVVHPSIPAYDLKGLIDFAKKNAGKMNYASGGIGTLNHLAMEQFRAAAGFDAVAAHYRGIGPAITDVLAGQAMMMMPGLAAALPHIKSQKMRPIAITGLKRHPLLPDVPTFEESGFKGFDGVQWYGIVGPAKLPAEITQRLNAEINRALAAPALRERLAGEAIEPMPMTPEQFGKFIQADIARWSALAKERKISLD